jgi:capsular polysaccharide biosynthesis protein
MPGVQVEVEVSRRYLGIAGSPARYLIVTIPPMQPDKLPSLREVADYAVRRVKTAD